MFTWLVKPAPKINASNTRLAFCATAVSGRAFTGHPPAPPRQGGGAKETILFSTSRLSHTNSAASPSISCLFLLLSLVCLSALSLSLTLPHVVVLREPDDGYARVADDSSHSPRAAVFLDVVHVLVGVVAENVRASDEVGEVRSSVDIPA